VYRLRPTHLVHPEHGKSGRARHVWPRDLSDVLHCVALQDRQQRGNYPDLKTEGPMIEYKGYRVIVGAVTFDGTLEWSFSVRKGEELVRPHGEFDRFQSSEVAAAAARKWIDEHRA